MNFHEFQKIYPLYHPYRMQTKWTTSKQNKNWKQRENLMHLILRKNGKWKISLSLFPQNFHSNVKNKQSDRQIYFSLNWKYTNEPRFEFSIKNKYYTQTHTQTYTYYDDKYFPKRYYDDDDNDIKKYIYSPCVALDRGSPWSLMQPKPKKEYKKKNKNKKIYRYKREAPPPLYSSIQSSFHTFY